MIIIVFGVSGAGKTTVGKLLAKDLGWRFLEADNFHPRANIEKMRSGRPLTDEDRWPWLERLREQIQRVEKGLDPINVVRDPDTNRRIPTGAWNTILSPAEAARHQDEDV